MKPLRYPLARYSIMILATLPLAALMTYLYQHRNQELSRILSGTRILLPATSGLAGLAALRFRKTLHGWFDRHVLVEPQRKIRIQAPPTFHLRPFAQLVFSRKVYTEVLEPGLRDFLDEYYEVMRQGNRWKAHGVRFRGYWSFWSAIVAQLPTSVLKLVYKIWRAVP